MCRNIAQSYPASLSTLEEYAEAYIELGLSCGENTDLMLELLGTMVYMPTDRWMVLMEKTQVLEFLQ